MRARTALVFDTGVYLVVVGMVLMVFEAFGDDPTCRDDGVTVSVRVTSCGVPAALLCSIGTYLMLQRQLRLDHRAGPLTHGANVLLITVGRRGRAPQPSATAPRRRSPIRSHRRLHSPRS